MRLKIFRSRYNLERSVPHSDIENGEDSVHSRGSVVSSLEEQRVASSSSQKTQEQPVNFSPLNALNVSQENTDSSSLSVQTVIHGSPPFAEVPASEAAHCNSTQRQENDKDSAADLFNERLDLNTSGSNQRQPQTLPESYYSQAPLLCSCNQCLANHYVYDQRMNPTYSNPPANFHTPNCCQLYGYSPHPQMMDTNGQPIPGSSNFRGYPQGESRPESYHRTSHSAPSMSKAEEEEDHRCVGMEVYSIFNSCVQQIGHLIACSSLKSHTSALLIPLCEVAKKSLKIQQQFNTALLANGHQNHSGTFCDFGEHSETSTEDDQTRQSSGQDNRDEEDTRISTVPVLHLD